MTASELRIGNWLQRLDGSKFKVSSSDLVIIEDISEKLHPKPIPITPEVLEKCEGFEPDEAGVKSKVYGNFEWIELNEQGDYIYDVFLRQKNFDGEIDIDTIIMNNQVQYLHQLQNLYFALTGEELQYKP